MAKDLPYFKFNVSEYINGNITLEDYYTQGVFINVCAFYWFRSGKVTLTELKRRLSKAKPKTFDLLIQNDLIKVDGDIISISFLDEQLSERGHVSVVNSENGKLGGRPKKSEEKPTALIDETETIAKKSNIEKKREEEKREREEESEFYQNPQKAFEDISNNFKETEPQRTILTNRGWRSASKKDTDALLYHFLESQVNFETQERSDVKSHFKRWLNAKPVEELQTLSKKIHERFQTEVR